MLIKRKRLVWIIFLALFVVIVTSLSAVLIATQGYINEGVVVIDAGHGGIDGGVSYGELVEADINLEIANILKQKLEDADYKVVMTRKDSHSLGKTKKEDMAGRAKIINSTKPDMVISIHVNKFVNASRRGVQVFYDDTGKNKDFANKFQSVINSRINAKYAKRTDLASLGGDYFITKCSNYPTVIVESGFLSNEEDRKLLVDSQYRDELTKCILDCIVSHKMSMNFC